MTVTIAFRAFPQTATTVSNLGVTRVEGTCGCCTLLQLEEFRTAVVRGGVSGFGTLNWRVKCSILHTAEMPLSLRARSLKLEGL